MLEDLKAFQLEDYPVSTYEKIRYADMDRQGHVNNAVFSTFLETGRVEILRDQELSSFREDSEFVIANLELNFLGEIQWPGTIEIGTGIMHIGNSSMKIVQGLYQNQQLKATAVSVIVQVDLVSRKSKQLTDTYKMAISKYMFHKK